MFMQLVQMPECGGFDLTWADSLRKAIAKKNPAGFEKLEQEFFENMKSKNLSKTLCNYVWKVLVSTSKGYGFNKSHTLAYSLIALQEMNLAYKFPVIYWNCACLISDSGGLEEEEANYEFDEETDGEIVWNSASELSIVDFSNDNEEESDDDEDEDDEDEGTSKAGKKKKTKATNYGKIASAIGKMISEGISVIPPDINKSGFTFTPDVESNAIRYGFRGITRISEELIKTIINNRPYESFDDFCARVKMNKPQTVNLIKAGAFDTFEDRIELMTRYIDSIADKKNAINLRNLQMLITNNMLPDKFEEQIRYFNFNKYLKKLKMTDFYALDNIAMNAIDKYCDIDVLVPSDESESGFLLPIKEWDKIWKKQQNILRPYIKAHEKEYIEQVNKKAFDEMWNKYATGNISKWEMDAISYYYHPHELKNVNHRLYQFRDFNKLSDNPEVEEMLMIKGKQIPLFRISRIAGTILDKDKNKKTLTLLTTTGVVNVKIFGDVFTHYDRQISEVGEDGKKHVIEKSFLARGNKIIVCGIRRDNMFIAKKYKRTPYHLVELITSIDDEGRIRTRGERMEV